jgi:hypothetical protein
LKAGTSFLKKFTGRIFKLVSVFKEASRKHLPFFAKRQPIIVKTISAHTKNADLIF